MVDFERSGKICRFTLTGDLLEFLLDKNIYFGNRETVRKRRGVRYSFENTVKTGQYSSTFMAPKL